MLGGDSADGVSPEGEYGTSTSQDGVRISVDEEANVKGGASEKEEEEEDEAPPARRGSVRTMSRCHFPTMSDKTMLWWIGRLRRNIVFDVFLTAEDALEKRLDNVVADEGGGGGDGGKKLLSSPSDELGVQPQRRKQIEDAEETNGRAEDDGSR